MGRARPSQSAATAESRAERKERTRQALLDAALELLTDRSLASLSLREVARQVGIVPTAFYRHFDSMDELGVALVSDSIQALRQMIRSARQIDPAGPEVDPIVGSVQILHRQVRGNEARFRFMVRERYGGVAAVTRAIDVELRQFASELTIDLARRPGLQQLTAADLEMAADLMVAAMLSTVQSLLEVDARHEHDEQRVIRRAERQLRLITLGMLAWRPDRP